MKRRFLFLFLLFYSFLYIFPFPLDAFPQTDGIFSVYGRAQQAFVHWTGKIILQLPDVRRTPFSDSGDTLFDFVFVFSFALLALVLAGLATLIIKQINYRQLWRWSFLALRYCIAFYMLVYGFDKVFKSHFPFPSLEKLMQPFGQSTPQGLLWAFMGYSTFYSTWIGVLEVVAGSLLLFKRTTAMGAIMSLIIMINVAFINFSYDVPVKLFALHMVGFSLILSWPFVRTIWDFFVNRKMIALPEVPEPVFPRFISSYRRIIKWVIIIAYTALFMDFSIENMKKDGDNAPVPPLYGIYFLEPADRGNEKPLDAILFDKKTTVLVYEKGNEYYDAKVDTVKRRVILRSNSDSSHSLTLSYQLTKEQLVLIEHDTNYLHFKKLDLNSLPLIHRKFHWIVEHPFNN